MINGSPFLFLYTLEEQGSDGVWRWRDTRNVTNAFSIDADVYQACICAFTD